MIVPGRDPVGPVRLAVPRCAGRLHGLKIVLAAVTLGALTAGIGVAVSAPGHVARTLPVAKSFTLPVLGHPGQTVSLARFTGQPLIVNFFASWCVPCKKETRCLPGSTALSLVDHSTHAR